VRGARHDLAPVDLECLLPSSPAGEMPGDQPTC